MEVINSAQTAANSVADGITYAAKRYWNNEYFNNGVYDINPAGVLVLGVHVVITLGYLLWAWLVKSCKRWYTMDPSAAGMFRLAAARGQIDKLETLKKCYRFNVNADVEGWTALHAAAAMGQPDSVAWLLSNGADLHAHKEDSWKDTVLHYAAAAGNMDCCKILLGFGADPRARNFAGLTPRDYAAGNNHIEVANHLDHVARALGDAIAVATPDTTRTPPLTPNQLRTGDVFYNAQASKTQPRRSSGADAMAEDPKAKKMRQRRKLRKLCRRGFEGHGSKGTVPTRGMWGFRLLGIISSLLGALYLTWRACRSLSGGWYYFYSIPLFTVEWLGWIGWLCCVLGLWSTIDRKPRLLRDMMKEEEYPAVDVFVVAYNEPVSVIEPTTIAALNLNYPPDKLTVYVLDDGKREEVRQLALKLDFQLQFKKKAAQLCYISREKVQGVPHHAKAGNINHALLKGGVVRGDYVLVLDCDMLCHPDFLQRTVGHMYDQQQGKWVPKDKVGFLQTPQDFWNVEAADPMFHLNSFFYGPMLKGRDGVGATPCAGTGVLFKRDVLTSIGGQSYGSITEDFNTAMHLLMSGFSTMYLDDHLTYGMSPDDVPSTFVQRLRWAMGAVQIYIRNNPLKIAGLTHVQAVLFYDSCASHFVAMAIIFVSFVPIVYMFCGVSPIAIEEGHVWEFTIAFLAFYLSNRITLLWAFMDSKTGLHALWRTSQQAVWIAPNHLKAVWRVLRTELPVIRWLSRLEIGFAVTKKDKTKPGPWKQFWSTLVCVWPFLLYYVIAIGAMTFVIVYLALGELDLRQGLGNAAAALWTVLTMLLIWPPISTLLPRIYTDEGWKVVWKLPNVTENTVGNAGTIPTAPSLQTAMSTKKSTALTHPEPSLALHDNGVGMDTVHVAVTPLAGAVANSPSSFSPHPLGPSRSGPSHINAIATSAVTAQVQHMAPHKSSLPLQTSLPSAVAFAIPDPDYPVITPTGDPLASNIGRVGVGLTRHDLQQLDSVYSGAPVRLPSTELRDVTDLFHKLAHQVDASTPPSAPDLPVQGPVSAFAAAQASARYPTIQHHTEPERQSELQSAGTLGRSLTIGGLQLRIRNTVPTVDAVHNPALAAEQAGGQGEQSGVQGEGTELQPNVSILMQAVQAVAEQESSTSNANPTQQWLANAGAYLTGGEQFITFGQNKRVAVSLLVEAMDVALTHGRSEEEQIHLFGQHLFSGGTGALLPQPSTLPVLQPADPSAAALAIAAAVQQPTVTVGDTPEDLADNSILAQPDFSLRRKAPRSYAFLIVFGVLVTGLAVAGILDALKVLE